MFAQAEALKFDHGACHVPASQFADAAIWVNPESDGERQLAALVYELLNAENSDDTNEVWAKVLRGQIDKEGYIREIGKLEHRALLLRAELWSHFWLNCDCRGFAFL